jgi:hypothetical protein
MPRLKLPVAPKLPARLSALTLAERTTGDRALRVASRFERANSGVILLELVYQTQTSVEDLDALAGDRGIEIRSPVLWVLSFAVALFHWFMDLLPMETQEVYATIAAETARSLDIAARLRAEARSAGDAKLAEWCSEWMAQRSNLVLRLTTSLGIDETHVYAQLPGETLEGTALAAGAPSRIAV